MLIATITTQRSGSKLVSSMLGTNPFILTTGEVFSPDNPTLSPNFHGFINNIGYLNALSRESFALLDEFFLFLLRSSGKPILHFDLMYNQFYIPTISWSQTFEIPIIAYLKERNSLIIHLERNPIDTFLSQELLIHQLSTDPSAPSHAINNNDAKVNHDKYFQPSLEAIDKFIEFQRFWTSTMSQSLCDYTWKTRLQFEECIAVVPPKLSSKTILTLNSWVSQFQLCEPIALEDAYRAPNNGIKTRSSYLACSSLLRIDINSSMLEAFSKEYGAKALETSHKYNSTDSLWVS